MICKVLFASLGTYVPISRSEVLCFEIADDSSANKLRALVIPALCGNKRWVQNIRLLWPNWSFPPVYLFFQCKMNNLSKCRDSFSCIDWMELGPIIPYHKYLPFQQLFGRSTKDAAHGDIWSLLRSARSWRLRKPTLTGCQGPGTEDRLIFLYARVAWIIVHGTEMSGEC